MHAGRSRVSRHGMRRANLIAAVVAGAGLALAGCGGSSGVSKSQYIAKADTICKATQAKTAPLINQIAAAGVSLLSGSATRARQVAAVVQKLRTVAAGALAQLRALAQPSGDHAAIEKFLTPLSNVVDTIGTAGTALSNGQAVQALGALQGLQTVAGQLASAAKAYGLHTCQSVVALSGG
jgi:hypothetical protein